MRSGYERHTELDDVLARAGKLPARTMIVDIEPFASWWNADQVPTDGLLARRLGFTFLHYQPQLTGVPLGPRLMRGLGQLALPLMFHRSAENCLSGHDDR